MKDGSEMASVHFALKYVSLGIDDDGDDYGSCAIEMVPGDAVEGAALADRIIGKTGANQQATREILDSYRTEILTNQPEISQVTIERKLLIELLKNAGCAANKTSDWINRAIGKKWLSNINGVLLEITQHVEK